MPARYLAVCIQEDVDGTDFRWLVDAYVRIINDEESLRNLCKQICVTILHKKYQDRGKYGEWMTVKKQRIKFILFLQTLQC